MMISYSTPELQIEFRHQHLTGYLLFELAKSALEVTYPFRRECKYLVFFCSSENLSVNNTKMAHDTEWFALQCYVILLRCQFAYPALHIQ